MMNALTKKITIPTIGKFNSAVEFEKEDSTINVLTYLETDIRDVSDVVCNTLGEAVSKYEKQFERDISCLRGITDNTIEIIGLGNDFTCFQTGILPLGENKSRLGIVGSLKVDFNNEIISYVIKNLLNNGYIIK